jgi:intein/homing endonuclease/phage-related protein
LSDPEFNMSREEIELISRKLTQALTEHLAQGEALQVQASGGQLLQMYTVVPEHLIAEAIDLDLIASSEHGITDIVGQIVGFFQSIANNIVAGINSFIAGVRDAIIGTVRSVGSMVVDAVADFTARVIARLIDYMGPRFIELLGAVADAITKIGAAIASAVSAISMAIATSIAQVSASLSAAIASVATSLSLAINQVATSLSAAITMLGTSIATQIVSVSAALSQAILNVGTSLSAAIASVGASISQTILSVSTALSVAINQVATSISGAIVQLSTSISGAIVQLSTSLSVAINQVATSLSVAITQVATALSTAIATLGTSLAFAISQVATSISGAILSMSATLSTAITQLGTSIVGTLGSLMTTAIAGIQLLQGRVDVAIAIMRDFFPQFSKSVADNLATISRSIRESFESVSSALLQFSERLTQTLTNNLSVFVTRVLESVERVVSTILKVSERTTETLVRNMEVTVRAIAETGERLGRAIANIHKEITDAIVSSFNKASEAIRENFARFMDTLRDQFLKMSDALREANQKMVDMILDTGKRTIDFIDESSRKITDTLLDNFSKFMDRLMAEMDRLSKALDQLGALFTGFVNSILELPGRFDRFVRPWAKAYWEELIKEQLKGWEDVWSEFPKMFKKESVSGWEALKIAMQASVVPRPVRSILKANPGSEVVELEDYVFGKISYENPTWISVPSMLFQPLISAFSSVVVPAFNSFADAILQGLKSLVAAGQTTLQTIIEGVSAGVRSLFESISSGLASAVQALFEVLEKVLSGLATAIEGFFKKDVEGIRNTTKTAVSQIFEMSGMFGLPELLKMFGLGTPEFLKMDVVQEKLAMWHLTSMAFITIPLWAQLPVRALRKALHALGNALMEHGLPLSVLLRPFGIGIQTSFDLGKALGAGLSHLSGELKEFLDYILRAYAYGVGIWTIQPVSKLVNFHLRNLAPMEMPTPDRMIEMVRRSMPHMFTENKELFETRLKLVRLYTAIQGFPDEVIDMIFRKEDEAGASIKVRDRFEVERIIPLSLMYALPSHSEVARMVIRDVIIDPDAIRKLFAATGLNRDLAAMFYYLHFRYPPPERLWTFYTRGISGLLWATITDADRSVLDKEKVAAGLPEGHRIEEPKNLNFQAGTLDEIIKTYMKWHDFARFCLPEGTVILGDNKPIESYKVGDYTLYGGTVKAVFRRPYKGKVVKVKAHGLLELRATPEHILPVVTGRYECTRLNGKNVWVFRYSRPYYKRIGELRPRSGFASDRDYLLVPILPGTYDARELDLSGYIKAKTNVRNTRLRLDEETAWFLGLYLAEGHSQEKYISIGQSGEARGIIERLCDIIRKLGYSPVVSKSRRITEVYIKSPILSRAFSEWFGRGARNKRIPDFILLHKDRRILEAFLDGYLSGDGWTGRHHGEHRLERCATTASKVLAMQLQLLLLRLGYVATVHHIKRTDHYLVRFIPREHKFKWIKFQGNYALFPVHRIDYEEYDGYVYDLEVENHHYLASNAIIHNSWKSGWPSDNLIVIDTLADIPTKIDQRWMVRFGLYELMSEKNVTRESPSEDFIKKVVEGSATSRIQLDLTNFCRTLQATGLHPHYVPITAVAEVINTIADERTLLRTGVINLYKEGFFDTASVHRMLTGVLSTSFKVSYFDMSTGKWYDGWINVPLRYLDMEARLIGLRAIMDRALDILRDIQRDVLTGYQEFIIETYEEFKASFSKVVERVNAVYSADFERLTGSKPPEELTLKFIDDYYRPLVESLDIWRDVWTVRRIRMWTQRWLGWLMYRIAQGVSKREEVEKLVEFMAKSAKLPEKERKYIEEVMKFMFDLSLREYIPTPMQLATIAEFIRIDSTTIQRALEQRLVPEEWRPIWTRFIEVRPIADDVRALISAYLRLARVVRKVEKIPEAIRNAVRSAMERIGFTEEEVAIFQLRVEIEELIAGLRESVPTPSQLATLAEFVKIPDNMVQQALEERNIAPDWRSFWAQYISIRPLVDDVRNLISSFLRALRLTDEAKAFESVVKAYATRIGFGDEEMKILDARIQLEEMVFSARQYVPTPQQLATIVEVLPGARALFPEIVKRYRISPTWQAVWAQYIDIRPLVDDFKRFLSRAEQLYIRFMVKKVDFDKIVESVLDRLGYTDEEKDFLMRTVELERWRNAWTELIGSVERLVSLSEYSPRASRYALAKVYEMIDALPLPDADKNELKAMWEEYIRNRPVKSEAKLYITQLSNLYAEGLISDADFDKELNAMKEWGFSDNEIMFYKARAALMKARKMKIPVGG